MSRIEELEKRLEADPNSRIFVQLAEEYRKQGLLENAIEICEAGLQKHPQYPSARVALGRALLEAETYDRASEEFETVLAQVPDNILANKFLGETYHRLGRYDEAIQKYQIAQTLAPEDTELEGKIEAVKAEMAGGGPPPPPHEPADASAPAAYAPPPPPDAAEGAPSSGMGLSQGIDEGMRPVDHGALEPTLHDSPGIVEPPPPVPDAPPPLPEAPASPEEPREDLAPVPLVDVDEPMVLESPAESYARASEPAEAPPAEEAVPLMSPSDPPPVPPPMEPTPFEPPAPSEPPFMESTPSEPPPLEPPPLEPAAVEPPPPPIRTPSPEPPVSVEPAIVENAPMMESPPLLETPPIVEASPMELPTVEATPVEPSPAHPPAAPTGDDGIETPTMAELYASQGHFDKAVTVYRNLLARDPNETQYLERIEELEMLAKASAGAAGAAPAQARGDGLSDSGRDKTIEVLEQWLQGIRRSRRA